MSLEELSLPHVPGSGPRLNYLRQGADWYREQIIHRLDAVIAERRAAAEDTVGVREGYIRPAYSQTLTYDEVFRLLGE